MASCELEARVLKKIPARFLADRVYDESGLAGLERDWGAVREDGYHARLKVRSRYCSMDELKAYVLSLRPDLDMSSWSAAHLGDGSVNVSAGGIVIPVPAAVYRSLATDHVTEDMYCNFQEGWTLDLDGFSMDWLRPYLPAYLDRDLVRKLAAARIAASAALDRAALSDRISEYGWSGMTGRTDVTGFLCDCLAYRPRGAAILLRILD